MLFLVTGLIEVSRYESPHEPERSKETRIIRAVTDGEAVEKFRKHFESKTSEYCTYYSVRDVEAFEEI